MAALNQHGERRYVKWSVRMWEEMLHIKWNTCLLYYPFKKENAIKCFLVEHVPSFISSTPPTTSILTGASHAHICLYCCLNGRDPGKSLILFISTLLMLPEWLVHWFRGYVLFYDQVADDFCFSFITRNHCFFNIALLVSFD